MFADQIIKLAEKHVSSGPMASSAAVALDDARSLYSAARFADAKRRALDSLSYSIGVFHADYRRAVGQPRA